MSFKPIDFMKMSLGSMSAEEAAKAADAANRIVESWPVVYNHSCVNNSIWSETLSSPDTKARLAFIESLVKESEQEIYTEVGEVNGEPIYKRVTKRVTR